MLGNSKTDVDQLNRCVKRYQFLSPRFNTSCFSNYSQRTSCSLPSHNDSKDITSTSTKLSPRFWRLFSSWRASCEASAAVPSATDRMEQAAENLKLSAKGGESTSIVTDFEIQEYLAKETGKDRLIKMFTKNHIGEYSPELQFIYQVSLQGAIITGIIMTFLASRQAKQEFVERNRITVFKTRFQASRRLHDKVFLFSMKEGLKWMCRVSLFSGAFMLISQSIAVYRNKSSFWECAVAGGTVFGVLKMNMGLRGFLVGSGFGVFLGLITGSALLGGMKATSETQEQRHYWQIQKELERLKFLENQGKVEGEAMQETAQVQ